jgi:hypothetical protein
MSRIKPDNVKMNGSVLKATEIIRKCGFPVLLGKMITGSLARLRKFLFDDTCMLFFEVPPNAIPPVHQMTRGLSSRFATLKELSGLNHFHFDFEKQRYLSLAAERFAKNDQCFVGILDGQIVFLSWIRSEGNMEMTETGDLLKIGEKEIYIYDCFTLGEYRGKKIYPSVLGEIIKKHPDFKKIIYCDAKNTPSEKGILAAGFVLKKKYRRLRILGFSCRQQTTEK